MARQRQPSQLIHHRDNFGLHDQAGIDRQEIVRLESCEREMPNRRNGKAGVITVAHWLNRADRRLDGDRLQVRDSTKLPVYQFCLPPQLRLVSQVLPLATTTRAKVGARRSNALRRRY